MHTFSKTLAHSHKAARAREELDKARMSMREAHKSARSARNMDQEKRVKHIIVVTPACILVCCTPRVHVIKCVHNCTFSQFAGRRNNCAKTTFHAGNQVVRRQKLSGLRRYPPRKGMPCLRQRYGTRGFGLLHVYCPFCACLSANTKRESRCLLNF
jgi:hypothetical protein